MRLEDVGMVGRRNDGSVTSVAGSAGGVVGPQRDMWRPVSGSRATCHVLGRPIFILRTMTHVTISLNFEVFGNRSGNVKGDRNII
jgi:hypothetical protein